MKKISATIAVIILCIVLSSFSFHHHHAATSPRQGFKPDYALYDQVLQKYVSDDGKVNYKGLKEDSDFRIVLESIALMHPTARWTRDEQKCFWINAYNMFVLKLVCDNYPLKSINEIPNAMDSNYVKIGINYYSLNRIRNEFLLEKFNDARILFSLSDASVSCPPLFNHAFKPEDLEKTLNTVTRRFVNDKRYNSINSNAPKLSKVFQLYFGDLAMNETLVAFINSYSDVQVDAKATIEYQVYDWSLNSK
ncbi:MAG: DUF547 domain-containing protein [Flavobacteriales bacterium]|nr:DUF547 domain-containing protein [Flavobacteriales bacterium]